ncbi:LOW QUALITY PROTEIN: hypothetical protein HID58_076274 [Brassica napus]|uniref:Uncharacterized protein n=1 Tax=Brassica napus TaxID=3708 RepID=A0ABQ7YM09_BRANA|nr:LOW QUALITY PROTEIN: hypothetical protein HID58_076274 [Brassica napus]
MKSGEAAVDQEDKIVVPPRKEPEVENKKKPEHEHFGEEKERKERKGKPLKEIEMENAAYMATVLSDLLGTITSYQSKTTFVAYKQCSGNKMDKVNEIEILSLAYIDVFLIMKCFILLLSKTRCSNSTLEKVVKINNNQSFIEFKCYDVLFT